ncbi:MAG: pentapeptide repeat-containing protein [Spirulina sp.]
MMPIFSDPQSQPSQEQRDRSTREIAHRLYLNRVARSREENEKTDWTRAEKIARNPLTKTAFWLEAGLEGLVNYLQNLAIIDLLNVVASFSLIVGVIGFYMGAEERRKQTHYQAWQVINSAVEREAESGRRAAIEDLWADEVDLSGLDLRKARIPRLDLSPHCSFLYIPVFSYMCTKNLPFFSEERVVLWESNLEEADLWEANLEGANLGGANLEGTNLGGANLERAYLVGVNLEEVYLVRANLERINLVSANLKGANLVEANLEGAGLGGANLEGANLGGANLERANLVRAKLEGANLGGVNLEGANLVRANLEGADLEKANLENTSLAKANLDNTILPDTIFLSTELHITKKLTQQQLEGNDPPFLCHSPVPETFGIDPDRDCDRLPRFLVESYPERFSDIAKAEEYVNRAR